MARFTSELVLRLVDAVSAPARNATRSIKGIGRAVADNNLGQIRQMSKSAATTVNRLTGDLVGATGALAGLGLAMRYPIDRARLFQSTLTDIGQKADLSRNATRAMGRDLMKMAPQVNQFAQDLATGLDTLSGLGLDPGAAMKMLAPIGKAATAYKAEISDLGRAAYSAVSNLKVPVDQTGAVLDVMAYAGKRGAFEIKSMAQYMPALAAAAEGLGQKGVGAVADLSAALQIAQRGAGSSAEAATNVGNLLQKIGSPVTVQKFKKMGVNLVAEMDALERRGRSPLEAIAELTNKTLGGDLQRLGYLFEDADTQQALRPLIRDLEEYRDIREKALNAGGGVQTDFIDRMRDSAEQTKATQIAADGLNTTLGQSLIPSLDLLAGVIRPWIDGLQKVVEAHPRVTASVIGAIGALAAFRVATIATKLVAAQNRKILIDLADGFVNVRKRVGGAAKGIAGAMAGAELQTHMLLGTMSDGPLKRFGSGLLNLVSPFRVVRGGLGLLRLALIGTGIGAVVVGIGFAASLIVKHWSGFVTFFQGVSKGFMAAIAPVLPILQPVIDSFKAFGGWIADFFKTDPGEDWSKFGEKVGGALGGVVLKLANFVAWIGEAIDKVRDFLGIKGKGPNVTVSGIQDWVGPKAKARPLPARARGGPVYPGQDYLVGEEGPEIARFATSGRIYPNGVRPESGRRSAGGGHAFTFNVTVNGSSGDPQAVASVVEQRLRRMWREASDGGYYDGDLRPA